MPQTVYLIDASPYIFRAYFSVSEDVTTPDGRPANAAYGFGGFLVKLLEEVAPSHLALAFDRSLNSSFRNEIYPPYKAQRELPPKELEDQLGWCHALGEVLGIACYVDERYEADDLIGGLVAGLEPQGHEVVIITSDKDLAQLVGPRVSLWDYARDERFGPAEVEAKFGVRPEQITDYLGLAGDSVDNIPGVRGVGKKTAAALLQAFPDLDAIYADLGAVARLPIRGAKTLAPKLEAQREAAFLSRRLATVATDKPAAVEVEGLRRRRAEPQRVEPLIAELGFDRLGERIGRLAG
ncbi:MAG: exodeoxyribonuclease IX [Acidobacteria bacterium]|nr:MAG: exodeoxyribonuclease IX [Acidobacteriota bacterium]